jgi:hypothetical protein
MTNREQTMKFFNTEGPIQPDIHYVLPPLARINTDEILALIAARKYFVLHAPRQTGKTTCLLALVEKLNRTGTYRAVYVNIEAAQAAREDVDAAMRVILSELASEAKYFLKDSFPDRRMDEVLRQAGGRQAFGRMLEEWSGADPRPLVLMIDEIDALIGDTLIAVLRQLRSGYRKRPVAFPQSVILCGVRDVRDYRIHSSKSKEIVTGGSAFNVKAESLRLGNFTPDDIPALYRQHTAETGQVFEDAVFPLVWELTVGQPWLVNALAYEACFRMAEGKDQSRPITVGLIEQAKENLILRRDTHLDQLADKLIEPRVRRVIEPMLSGVMKEEKVPPDDLQYVRDLGLVTPTSPLAIANGIYREVIPRELTWSEQEFILDEAAWYVSPDGSLDMVKLLKGFQQFFRENSEIWLERFDYKEAGPQLLMQAFLQRVVNGGGDIRREYGLGRGRTDLLIVWPHQGGVQRIVIELKVARARPDRVIAEGLAQTADYMDRSNAAEGHLVIFDRRPRRKWSEKIFHRTRSFQKRRIVVWGL